MADDVRFRQSNDYAGVHGFFTGFPNFHQADYGQGVVYGTILVKGGTGVEWRDVKRTEYNVYTIENIPAMFRAAGDYASRNGYRTAFPTFHQADYGQGVVYGTILLRDNIVEWRDVKKVELGNPSIDDVGTMMRAANDYAFRKGFAAGFPTFHQANYGSGVVYGIILFKPGTVIGRDVPADLLSRYSLPSDPWAIILCHLSDVPPQQNSAQRYINFFTERGSGTGGAFDYWRELSYGVGGPGDMRGTTIFGWFNIGHSKAELLSYSGQTQRAKIFSWGIESARLNSVPIDRYRHKIIVLNVSADHGKAGGGVVLAYEDSRPLEPTFFFHEMGHELGFDHSFGENSNPCAGGDSRAGAYCNRYDIMSAMNVFFFYDSQNRISGPSLNAPTRERMKWIHKSRIWIPNSENFSAIINLAPLNKPAIDGYLMVKIFNSAADTAISNYSAYTIEFRQKSGWDSGIPVNVALIHGIPPNGPIKLLTNTRGGEVRSGEEYTFPGSRILCKVENIDATTSRLTLRLWTNIEGLKKWVRSLYLDLLNREPDQGGFNYYVDLINRGTNKVSIVESFLRSLEYCTIVTNSLYQKYLERQSDPGGLQYYRNMLSTGTPIQNVIVSLCDSPEFKNKYPVPYEFTRALYNKILERPPEAGAVENTPLLFGVTTTTYIRRFLTSPEYASKVITSYYNKYLGRAPEPGAVEAGIPRLQNESLQQIIRGFLVSDEYQQRSSSRVP